MILNEDIRAQLRKKPEIGVAMLADELGVSESTLYRKLRHKLESHERKEIREAIDRCRFVLRASDEELEQIRRAGNRVEAIDEIRKARSRK